jgi:hypothetical protein
MYEGYEHFNMSIWSKYDIVVFVLMSFATPLLY